MGFQIFVTSGAVTSKSLTLTATYYTGACWKMMEICPSFSSLLFRAIGFPLAKKLTELVPSLYTMHCCSGLLCKIKNFWIILCLSSLNSGYTGGLCRMFMASIEPFDWTAAPIRQQLLTKLTSCVWRHLLFRVGMNSGSYFVFQVYVIYIFFSSTGRQKRATGRIFFRLVFTCERFFIRLVIFRPWFSSHAFFFFLCCF